MASTEDKAYEIMKELDVDYVLVIFGGLTGYSSDGKSNDYVDLLSFITVQTSTNSCGWSVSVAALQKESTSRSTTITPRLENSGWTGRAPQLC